MRLRFEIEVEGDDAERLVVAVEDLVDAVQDLCGVLTVRHVPKSSEAEVDE